MLPCQLCVLDDKTDSKSKWAQKTIVWLYYPDYLSSLFCEDSNPWWFAATMTIHAKWVYRTLTQGIRRLKTLTCTKSSTADKNITQKKTKQEEAANVEITVTK